MERSNDQPQQVLLWRLGEPDGDCQEFALVEHHTDYLRLFPQDVRFEVGQDDPQRGWSYVHPGPADDWAGGRAHPFRVGFWLHELPSTVACRLVLYTANRHPFMPPVLQVEVNGRYTVRYQLPPGKTHIMFLPPRAESPHRLSVQFPTAYLQQGHNEITLTVVEGSWMLYDAVLLKADPAIPAHPEVVDLQAETAPLFRRVEGRLWQAVRVRLRNVGIEGEGEAWIEEFPDSRRRLTLKPDENLFHLLIPPLEETRPLHLRLGCGAREWNLPFEGRPQRRWTVFLAPSSHTDIGYTDLQEHALQRHLDNTLDAIRACQQDPHFRWNLEVAYHAVLLQRRYPREFQELRPLIREGRIGFPGMYVHMLTGLCSGEELIRVLARPHRFAQKHRLGAVRQVSLSDVPTAVGTLPMLLRGMGVRYFAEAVNNWRAPVFAHADPRAVSAPFWWQGLDGSCVLAILTDSYAHALRLGLFSTLETAEECLVPWLNAFAARDYPYDVLYAYGGVSDNQPLNPRYARVVEEWNREWEHPRFVLCRPEDYFQHIAGRYGHQLPTLRGDFGVYWEDGAVSSAHETALTRWAKRRLESAEAWWALVSWLSPGHAFPAQALEEAWEEVIFYDEHTWGAWCSVWEPHHEQTHQQWARKAAFAQRAAEKATALWQQAQEQLPALVVSEPAPAPCVLVWNELGWERHLAVELPLPDAEDGWRVRDARDGRLLPVQRRGERLLFLAERVPSCGYATFQLERGEPPSGAPLLRQEGEQVWQGAGWRLQIDPRTGGVSSLRSGERGEEWVQAGAHPLNGFLYMRGGENSRMVQPYLGEPQLQQFTHMEAEIRLVEDGALFALLHARRYGWPAPPVDTWIVLWHDGRIDFVNLLHKQETLEREGGYFVFPLRFPKPDRLQGYVELPYGVVQVDAEQPPGGCREWYCAHSFAALSDGERTAYLATPHAPLLTFNEPFLGKWRHQLLPLHGVLFAYVFHNYWDTNYRAAQGGDLLFSFSLRLREGKFDAAEATRFGWERLVEMSDPRAPMPVSASPGWSHPGRPVKPAASWLWVDSPGQAVVIGGVTREGNRLLVRLYNPTSRRARARLRWEGWTPREARRTDLLGRSVGRVSLLPSGLEVQVPARRVLTLAIW